MMSLDEQIDLEVKMYVGYCEAAARHDAYEQQYRMLAHGIFYHIQELRSTKKQSTLGRVILPISSM
jgi:transposase